MNTSVSTSSNDHNWFDAYNNNNSNDNEFATMNENESLLGNNFTTTGPTFFENFNDSTTRPDDYDYEVVHWCDQPRQHFNSLLQVVLLVATGSACDLLCIISHVFVLLAFALNASSIFAQPGHYYLLYLVNLSVCDLAISLVSVPSRLLMDLRGCWPLGNTLCTVYQVISWLALNGRALTYCAIAYDRYLMIAEGVAYSIKCTRQRILWKILFLWLFTLAIYTWPHFYDLITGTSTRWPGQCVPEFTVNIYLFNTLIIFSNFFSPLLLAMLYVIVWMALRQRQRAAQNLKKPAPCDSKLCGQTSITTSIITNGSSTPRSSLKTSALNNSDSHRPLLPLNTSTVEYQKDTVIKFSTAGSDSKSNSSTAIRDKRASRRARRATRSMMLLTSTFLVCQIPFGLTMLTLIMCPNDCCKTSGHFIWRLMIMTQYLLFFNSLLNPFLYGIAFPAVRTAIEALLPKSLVSCIRYCWSACFSRQRSKRKSSAEMLTTSPDQTVQTPLSNGRGALAKGGHLRASYRRATTDAAVPMLTPTLPLSAMQISHVSDANTEMYDDKQSEML